MRVQSKHSNTKHRLGTPTPNPTHLVTEDRAGRSIGVHDVHLDLHRHLRVDCGATLLEQGLIEHALELVILGRPAVDALFGSLENSTVILWVCTRNYYSSKYARCNNYCKTELTTSRFLVKMV